MTRLLERALDKIERLSEREQDEVAGWLLEELAAEGRWTETFDNSGDLLRQLADEALEEHASGQTQELDPDRL